MIPGPGGEHAGVYVGDNRELMRQMPDRSVHCIVTSPVYWGLRDYGTATWEGGDQNCKHTISMPTKWNDPKRGTDYTRPEVANRGGDATSCFLCGARRIDKQLGLESTIEEYVANQVAVFRECWRVLRDDGTLWLNLGDSYNGSGGAGGDYGAGGLKDGQPKYPGRNVGNLKPKDLCGIPWRVAFALQADGWYLRSDIIWHKPNPMPESVTDRPTKSHEYIFLLTKSSRYFYDAEAIREGSQANEETRKRATYGRYDAGDGRAKRNTRTGKPDYLQAIGNDYGGSNRNRRSVWTVTTKPFSGAHFATFPPDLIEPCIKAGTSERGVCPACGAPWERVVEKSGERDTHGVNHVADNARGDHGKTSVFYSGKVPVIQTTGWQPTCTCDGPDGDHPGSDCADYDEWPTVPAIVFDPYMGAGTTGLVAFRLGRRYLGTELNQTYAQMARDRIVGDAPLLAMIGGDECTR